jgi:hypothetical protein
VFLFRPSVRGAAFACREISAGWVYCALPNRIADENFKLLHYSSSGKKLIIKRRIWSMREIQTIKEAPGVRLNREDPLIRHIKKVSGDVYNRSPFIVCWILLGKSSGHQQTTTFFSHLFRPLDECLATLALTKQSTFAFPSSFKNSNNSPSPFSDSNHLSQRLHNCCLIEYYRSPISHYVNYTPRPPPVRNRSANVQSPKSWNGGKRHSSSSNVNSPDKVFLFTCQMRSA